MDHLDQILCNTMMKPFSAFLWKGNVFGLSNTGKTKQAFWKPHAEIWETVIGN